MERLPVSARERSVGDEIDQARPRRRISVMQRSGARSLLPRMGCHQDRFSALIIQSIHCPPQKLALCLPLVQILTGSVCCQTAGRLPSWSLASTTTLPCSSDMPGLFRNKSRCWLNRGAGFIAALHCLCLPNLMLMKPHQAGPDPARCSSAGEPLCGSGRHLASLR